MRWHMHDLQLWEFFIRKLPCPPCPTAPTQLVILETATGNENEKIFFVEYGDCLASCES
jgi:hypothetical protein